jgi:transcriptional regulator with XRE-family HTH domain
VLGSLIREYREFAGYSRWALGEQAGISQLELERWEIAGVPLPPTSAFLGLADFLDVPSSAVETALAERAEGQLPRLPRDQPDAYGAVPVLEYALDVSGWTPEEIAEVLETTPTKVQAWRLGAIEMAPAERSALTALVLG